MTIEDLKELTFHTRQWCILSSHERNGYMLGFMACQDKVRKILEKEAKEQAKSLATYATNDFNIKILEEKIINNKNILEKYNSMAGIDGFKVFIKEEIEQYKIEIKKIEAENEKNEKE